MNFNGSELKEIISNIKLLKLAKNPASVLLNCKIVYKDGKLFFYATDLVSYLTMYTSSQNNVIDNPDSNVYEFLLPISLLSLIFKGKSISVSFEKFEDGKINVNGTYYSVNKDDLEKFPIFNNAYDSLPSYSYDEEFIQSYKNASPFVFDDETMYYMNGVYLENKNSILSIVATDGRRLYKNDFLKCNDAVTKGIVNLFNPKLLNDTTVFYMGEKNIYFVSNNKILYTFLIDGQFPNYERVIPDYSKNSYEFIFNENFYSLVKNYYDFAKAAIGKDFTKSGYVTFSIQSNKIIMIDDYSVGFSNSIDADYFFLKNEYLIRVNALYLFDVYSTLGESKFRVSSDNNYSPLQFMNKKGEMAIVMPCRIE